MARDITGAPDRQYRRGAMLGLTMAECFLLLAFALLLLLGGWQASAIHRDEVLTPVLDLEPRHREALIAAVADPDLQAVIRAAQTLPRDARAELARDLRARADPRERLTQVPEDRWRFVSADLAARLVAGLAQVPPDQKARLADLVELTEPMTFGAALTAAEAVAGAGQSGAVEGGSSAVALVDRLRTELGDAVVAAGGEVTAEGAMVFPEGVLFELGSARIRPGVRATLQSVCPAWLRLLDDSGDRVRGARIEGHASSGWGQADRREAYLRNLDLSQSRAAAVVEACLRALPVDSDLNRWAETHLRAVGFSSAQPVRINGLEDPAKSRRVVFAVEFDRIDPVPVPPIPDAAGP